MRTKVKKKVLESSDRPLTTRGFLEGLDKFYEKKIEPRFAEYDKKFSGFDKKFSGFDKKFSGFDKKLAGFDKKFSGFDKKFSGFDKKLSEHDMHFMLIREKLAEHDKKFSEHDKKFDDLFNHIDGLCKKFDDLKIEYHVITAALERIESYIKQDVQDKTMMRDEIARLKSDATALVARVEILEKQVAA